MNRTTALAALLICLVLAALDQTAVATALPTISTDLGTTAAISWVMSTYLLTAAVSTPVWGKLSDLHGRRLLLQVAVVIFVLGSVWAGFASDIVGLVSARAVQGVGGGGMVVLVFAAVADLVSPRERGRFVGLFGAAFGLASVLGPVAGGALTQAASWRWIFFLNIPLGLLALLAITFMLRLPRPTGTGRIDWLGAALLVAAVGGVMLGLLSADPASGWPAVTTIALIGVGIVATVALLRVERRSVEPLLPLRVVNHPVVRITASLGLIVGLATIVTIIYASAYLQGVLGATPSASGVQLLPFVGGTLLASVVVGRRVSASGTYRIYPIVGAVIATLGMVVLSRLGVDTPYVVVAIGLTLVGVGVGAIIPVLTVAAQSAVAARDIGVVTSTSSLARLLGSTLGATAFGLIWGLTVASGPDVNPGVTPSVESVASATQITFLIASLVMALAIMLSLRLPSVHLRSTLNALPSDVP
jgi:EmrB/QacA subfamily drug resistance transporter